MGELLSSQQVIENAELAVSRGRGSARLLQPDVNRDSIPSPQTEYENLLDGLTPLFGVELRQVLPDTLRSTNVTVDPVTAQELGMQPSEENYKGYANVLQWPLLSRIEYDTAPNGELKIRRGKTFLARTIEFPYTQTVDGIDETTLKRIAFVGFMPNTVAQELNKKDLAYEKSLLEATGPFIEGVGEVINSGRAGELTLIQPTDAYADSNEAVRDTLIRRLGLQYNVPALDEILTANEASFPSATGENLVISMDEALQLGLSVVDETAENVSVPGTWRGVTINRASHDITIIEIETPTTYVDGTTDSRRMIKITIMPRQV